MRKEEITLYEYDELSEDAQEKAFEKLYDLNVDYEWWEFIYEDAKNIGLDITSFDLAHRHGITGKLTDYMEHVINNIIENHGDTCDTYKTALGYQKECEPIYEKLVTLQEDEDENADEIYDIENQLEDLEKEFKHDLLEDYLSILYKEFDYLTSREAIEENIRASEYEFTEDGKLY